MANKVWHTHFDIGLDLVHVNKSDRRSRMIWEILYQNDCNNRANKIRVADRGLRCDGVCWDAGVTAWMHLRERNGRCEAVHEHAEDEARHKAVMSDEHKAYQERVVLVATAEGHTANTEVHTPVGRTSIRTDTLVEGVNGLRIGWEIQLSTADRKGPRSVRARAAKALQNGITPAWHTDRADYATRNDTQWTRSDNLPAHIIAKTGDLRVVSGFRALDIWRCDGRALYPCTNGGWGRCGRHHVTPKPRDILFDDLVRKTASGLVVPIEHQVGRLTHRFWVTSQDQLRYIDVLGVPTPHGGGAAEESTPSAHASENAPTCRPQVAPEDAYALLIPGQRAVSRVPPVLQPVPRGRCEAGVSGCGDSARLYPCGWRCVNHAPGPAAAV